MKTEEQRGQLEGVDETGTRRRRGEDGAKRAEGAGEEEWAGLEVERARRRASLMVEGAREVEAQAERGPPAAITRSRSHGRTTRNTDRDDAPLQQATRASIRERRELAGKDRLQHHRRLGLLFAWEK